MASGFEVRDVRSDRSTLSDAVADDIADRILRGELASGQRLPTENELCDLVGVSRSVVRDAIRTLAARRLVEVRQGSGTIVAAPDDSAFSEALMGLLMRSGLSVGEVFDGRSAIETQVAAMAAERGADEDWAQLDSDLGAFSEAVDRADWQAAHEHHLRFHLDILHAVHLPAVELMLMPMQSFILISSLPPRGDDPSAWEVESHHPILEALRAGDAEAARKAMRRHFEYTETPEYEAFRATPFSQVAELEHAAGVSAVGLPGRS